MVREKPAPGFNRICAANGRKTEKDKEQQHAFWEQKGIL